MNKKTSNEVQVEAMRIAKGTQKPGQSKEQTKLVAQGIEKGIAEYKKQQKVKSRERDKQRKQQSKPVENDEAKLVVKNEISDSAKLNRLAWILLVLSWVGFVIILSIYTI